MVTMPGTNLTLPYQLKESTERSERQRELAITQDGALNENSHDEESKAEQAKVTELMRLFESFQPGLPPPREILDKDSILLQSNPLLCFIQLNLSDLPVPPHRVDTK